MLNKKQQGRMFLCTLNDAARKYTPEIAEEYLKDWHHKHGAKFVTGQIEQGKEGTQHIQYFIHFSEKCTVTRLKKFCNKSHFSLVRFNNGADEYTNKEDTRVAGPWTFGIRPPRNNKKGDIKRHNEQLLEMGAVEAVKQGLIRVENFKKVDASLNAYRIANAEAHDNKGVTRGIWIWGPSGVGKSRLARSWFPGAFPKEQNKWWDGYTGQEAVILDDLDTHVLGHHLKIWADSYPCTGESKGSTIPLLHRHFVVTCGKSIQELFKDTDQHMVDSIVRRFKVHHLTELPDIFRKQKTE